MGLPGIDDVKDAVGLGKGKKQTDASPTELYAGLYQPILSNWYTAKPYGFKFTPKGSDSAMVMYLPIAPYNINIQTHFATAVTETLYGVVEEHSPVRYYDITIEGTTGMAPKYVFPKNDGEQAIASGRSTFIVKQVVDPGALKGFFSNTLENINTLHNKTAELLGATPEVPTGIQLDQTGYLAFHNLYRFLLKYKKDVSEGGAREGLIFFSYKDNTQYKVILRTMSLRRDREDPMMYMYSITMRGYDLSTLGEKEKNNDKKEEEMLRALGLEGIGASTLLDDIKNKANQARDVLASVGGSITQLGR